MFQSIAAWVGVVGEVSLMAALIVYGVTSNEPRHKAKKPVMPRLVKAVRTFIGYCSDLLAQRNSHRYASAHGRRKRNGGRRISGAAA